MNARDAASAPPGARDGSYLQSFEVPVSIEVTGARLELGDEALERGRDFEAFLSSASGVASAEVVFVGYGITAPELGYDDYAGVDVEGRIALVLDDRPAGDAPVAGRRGVAFLRRAYKLSNARRHGAVAVLLAPSSPEAEGLPGNAGNEPSSPTIGSSEIVAVALSHGAASRIVAEAGGESLEARRAGIDAASQPASSVLDGVRLRVSVDVVRRRGTAANVVGLLPGADAALRHEVVVIGAHYDHLGRGAYGSLAPDRRGEIHNGANDNASGTAGLLALARAFGAGPAGRRTLALVAFTAEEVGLLGSSQYVRDPAIPIEDTVAMINLDMIGTLGQDPVLVFGTKTSPGFAALVERAAEGLPLSTEAGGGGYAPSDQTSFYARDVPVLFFFTGTHPGYHTPDDDAALVDSEGIARVVQLVYRTARALLDADVRPEVISAEAPARDGGGPGYGPYLGTVPDFAASPEPGVRLQAVRAGSPAENAGLLPGDRIVSFDGAPIANLEEYAALLFACRPGQRVEIAVVRDGRRVSVEAVLGQRR